MTKPLVDSAVVYCSVPTETGTVPIRGQDTVRVHCTVSPDDDQQAACIAQAHDMSFQPVNKRQKGPDGSPITRNDAGGLHRASRQNGSRCVLSPPPPLQLTVHFS